MSSAAAESGGIANAYLAVFLTPHLNILVGIVEFTKMVHAVHPFIVNLITLFIWLDIGHTLRKHAYSNI